jgi:hypothetical protein
MIDRDDVTAADTLVQRFIDQELSGDERLQLLVRLGREQALRDRVIDLERLAVGARRLPRPVVPDDFVQRVMTRTDAPSSRWRRAFNVLWMPRSLQWNLAGAMAAAVLVLVAGGAIALARLAAPRDVVSTVATAQPAQVFVRLVILQPEARTVEVAGDFNGWDPRRTPLEQLPTGAWTVTLPLEPGRYEYMFVVDGSQWIADPFADEETDDGFGSRNAVLDVRSPMEASL